LPLPSSEEVLRRETSRMIAKLLVEVVEAHWKRCTAALRARSACLQATLSAAESRGRASSWALAAARVRVALLESKLASQGAELARAYAARSPRCSDAPSRDTVAAALVQLRAERSVRPLEVHPTVRADSAAVQAEPAAAAADAARVPLCRACRVCRACRAARAELAAPLAACEAGASEEQGSGKPPPRWRRGAANEQPLETAEGTDAPEVAHSRSRGVVSVRLKLRGQGCPPEAEANSQSRGDEWDTPDGAPPGEGGSAEGGWPEESDDEPRAGGASTPELAPVPKSESKGHTEDEVTSSSASAKAPAISGDADAMAEDAREDEGESVTEAEAEAEAEAEVLIEVESEAEAEVFTEVESEAEVLLRSSPRPRPRS